jgi:hypothetical protein
MIAGVRVAFVLDDGAIAPILKSTGSSNRRECC